MHTTLPPLNLTHKLPGCWSPRQRTAARWPQSLAKLVIGT